MSQETEAQGGNRDSWGVTEPEVRCGVWSSFSGPFLTPHLTSEDSWEAAEVKREKKSRPRGPSPQVLLPFLLLTRSILEWVRDGKKVSLCTNAGIIGDFLPADGPQLQTHL